MVRAQLSRLQRSVQGLACLACLAAPVGALQTTQELTSAYQLKGQAAIEALEDLKRRWLDGLQGQADDHQAWIYVSVCNAGIIARTTAAGQWLRAIQLCDAALVHPAPPAYRGAIFALRSEALRKAGDATLAENDAREAVRLAHRNLERSLADEVAFNKSAYAEAYDALARAFLAQGRHDECVQTLEAMFDEAGEPKIKSGAMARRDILMGTASAERFLSGDLDSDAGALEFYTRCLGRKGAMARDLFFARTRLAHLHLRAGRMGEAAAALDPVGIDDPNSREDNPSINSQERAWLLALRARLVRLEGGIAVELIDEASRLLVSDWQEHTRTSGVAFLRYGRQRIVLSEQIEHHLLAGGAKQALAALLRTQEVGAIYSAVGAQPVSLSDIRSRLLSDSAGGLVFVEGKDRGHVIAFDRSEARHAYLPQRSILKPRVQELQRAQSNLAARPGDPAAIAALESEAQALSELLLPGEVGELVATWSEAWIVGREMVYNAPLELLALGDDSLGCALALSDLPGFAVGLELQRRSRSQGRALGAPRLLFDAPLSPQAQALDPELQALPRLDPERLPGWAELTAWEPLGGESATVEALFGKPRPGLQQVLSHGLRDPAQSGNGFAVQPSPACEDGILGTDDLRAFAGAEVAPLVLLTTCKSRGGTSYRGDSDAANMGGVLLSLGAQAAVLSPAGTDVYWNPTLSFSNAVMEGLSAGESVAEAMRLARQQLVRDAGPAGLAYGAQWTLLGWGGLTVELPERRAWPDGSRGLLVLGAVLLGLLAAVWLRPGRQAPRAPRS